MAATGAQPLLSPEAGFLAEDVPIPSQKVITAKQAFIPLSPGPEKAKLHMDAVASLLGLAAVEPTTNTAAPAPAPAPTAAPAPAPTPHQPPLDQWTPLPGPIFAIAKRIDDADLYARSLSLPSVAFEALFGRGAADVSATAALVQAGDGPYLALAAAPAAAHGPGVVGLRAGALFSSLHVSPGDVMVLSADPDGGLRAKATLGMPPLEALGGRGGAAGTGAAGSAAGSGSPPASRDSLTQLTDGEGTEDDRMMAGARGGRTGTGAGTAAGRLGTGLGLAAVAAAAASDDFDADADPDDLAASPNNANDDPDWRGGGSDGSGARRSSAKRGPGRPRKRRPAGRGVGGISINAGLACAHCGTRETPRWWKDAFPAGALCNACGIWLKRHGYPRPVQFFSVPSAAGVGVGMGMGGGDPAVAGPPRSDFYLINGRPKRRRTAATTGGGGGDSDGYNGTAIGGAMALNATTTTTPVVAAAAAAAAGGGGGEPAINFGAAGSRVFVMRRKLIATPSPITPDAVVVLGGGVDTAKEPDSTPVVVAGGGGGGDASATIVATPTPTTTTTTTTAALVHFGWAPGSRAAHDMFDRVSAFAGASPIVAVEDFELLADTKATATLTLRPGVAVPNDWDAIVREFVDAL